MEIDTFVCQSFAHIQKLSGAIVRLQANGAATIPLPVKECGRKPTVEANYFDSTEFFLEQGSARRRQCHSYRDSAREKRSLPCKRQETRSGTIDNPAEKKNPDADLKQRDSRRKTSKKKQDDDDDDETGKCVSRKKRKERSDAASGCGNANSNRLTRRSDLKKRLRQVGVRSRVEIYWEEKKEYFPATIVAEHGEWSHTYTFLYDDGCKESFDLSHRRFHVLDDAIPKIAVDEIIAIAISDTNSAVGHKRKNEITTTNGTEAAKRPRTAAIDTGPAEEDNYDGNGGDEEKQEQENGDDENTSVQGSRELPQTYTYVDVGPKESSHLNLELIQILDAISATCDNNTTTSTRLDTSSASAGGTGAKYVYNWACERCGRWFDGPDSFQTCQNHEAGCNGAEIIAIE